MRTTVDLDDEVLRQAQQAAVAEGVTLTRLIEDAVRADLDRRRELPRDGLADSAALVAIMDNATS